MELDSDMYDDNYDGPGPARTEAKKQEIDQDPSENAPRDNALHLRGTDDMSTSDVHKYLSLFTTDSKPRIEWIDDSSLNLVYYTAEDAKVALAHITTVPTDQIDSQSLAPAQNNPEKPDARLSVRFARTSDKKERGAKDRSRWYLFHPEDDPDSRPKHRRREGREGPYSRNGRHEKRVASGTPGSADLFASRLGEISGLKSEELPETKKSDLFEAKVVKQEPLSGEDLFASRILEATKHSRNANSRTKDSLPDNDLFARIASPRTSGQTLADRITGSRSTGGDLFPDRTAAAGDLRDRISGGPIRNKGITIRGAGRRAKASDLF